MSMSSAGCGGGDDMGGSGWWGSMGEGEGGLAKGGEEGGCPKSAVGGCCTAVELMAGGWSAGHEYIDAEVL